MNPTSVLPGAKVTITGSGFGSSQGNGQVWLGTAYGVVQSWSDGQVVATVAPGSLSGNAQVLQNGVWSNSVAIAIHLLGLIGITPASGAARARHAKHGGGRHAHHPGAERKRPTGDRMTWTSSDLTLSDVESARELLRERFQPSRLLPAESLGRLRGGPVFLKMESELPTRSFKVRGATYALARNLARREIREVTAASTGNHGAAVAYAARMLNVQATIFLPTNPNPVKRRRIAALGANIVEFGRDLCEAHERAVAYSREDGVFLLDDASDPDLPAGTATIGCEILEQEPSTRVIYVPVGDSALIRGIALAAKTLRPDIRIAGVQAEQAPSYFLSWRSGGPVSTETCATIADGLATRRPRAANVDAIRKLVDDMRLVSEKQMLAAIKHLLMEELVLAEPAGAAATAALLAEAGSGGGAPAVVLVTGANISEEVLRAALAE